MRYTTLIDIRELPSVWRCESARTLYYFFVLACGYHDDDRDTLDISFRGLAAVTGLSLAAVRHGCGVLMAAKLLRRQGDLWIVTKWIPTRKISARPQEDAQATARREEEKRQRAREQRIEERQRARSEELKAAGKTEFMLYYEGLEAKAAAGDAEAARLMERHRATYEAHKANLKTKKK